MKKTHQLYPLILAFLLPAILLCIEGPSAGAVKEQLDFFSKTLPDNFNMLSMMELAEPLLSQESSPYVVVALQECQRMNVLLTEIRRSLSELDKGNFLCLYFYRPIHN
jgi:Dynein heavy chain C-terminal domain